MAKRVKGGGSGGTLDFANSDLFARFSQFKLGEIGSFCPGGIMLNAPFLCAG